MSEESDAWDALATAAGPLDEVAGVLIRHARELFIADVKVASEGRDDPTPPSSNAPLKDVVRLAEAAQGGARSTVSGVTYIRSLSALAAVTVQLKAAEKSVEVAAGLVKAYKEGTHVTDTDGTRIRDALVSATDALKKTTDVFASVGITATAPGLTADDLDLSPKPLEETKKQLEKVKNALETSRTAVEAVPRASAAPWVPVRAARGAVQSARAALSAGNLALALRPKSSAGSAPAAAAAAADAAAQAVKQSLASLSAAADELDACDALSTSIKTLMPVAASAASVREWFPVDPEMTPIRSSGLVPSAMTPTDDPAEPAVKPENESFDVLLKKLLAHLAE